MGKSVCLTASILLTTMAGAEHAISFDPALD